MIVNFLKSGKDSWSALSFPAAAITYSGGTPLSTALNRALVGLLVSCLTSTVHKMTHELFHSHLPIQRPRALMIQV